jgi:hypothetical protein
MKNNHEGVSRRRALKAIGSGFGAVPILAAAPSLAATPAEPSPSAAAAVRASSAPDLVSLSARGTVVTFDRRLGTVYGITREHDRLHTNFLGNSDNTRGVVVSDTHWTGDVVATVWDMKNPVWDRQRTSQAPGRWVEETTLASDDVRRVEFDGTAFRVAYGGRSQQAGGIRSFRLAMSYRFANDQSLICDIEITNSSAGTLELGELGIPLRANDDYAAPYGGLGPTAALRAGRMPEIQRVIHEEKVFAHTFVAGHSSYVLLQRPKGDGPFLLVHGLGDTAFECVYKTLGSTDGTWIGTDVLAIHSRATCMQRGWDWNPWVNGHTSLVLEPGEQRSYTLRFVFVDDYAAIRTELAGAGNLGVRVLPSMVVQEDTDVFIEISSREDVARLDLRSDGMTMVGRRRVDGATLVTLRFHGRGQKTLRASYGEGRWTNLHFFCVTDAAELIKARARFMIDRQFYENPADPWNRNHLFLPFDYRQGKRLDDFDDVWEVGGTGDPGFGEPLFLSQKNVHFPSRDEVETLERYVSDCLFRHIQNPQTYEIRASLFWKTRYPSSYSSTYSQARSEETWRTYNYAFAANIYHALYRIGREYDILTRRTALDYLRICYETCRKWFTTGPYTHVGMIGGANAVEVLADIRREGWTSEAGVLQELMRACNDEFLRDPYPYCSEIEIDETGQHQVYFFSRLFGLEGDARSLARSREVLTVLKAMRGGDQPVWFCYGNDLFAHPDFRGQIACWHAESINGMALLRGFEDTGDLSMLTKGYAGVMSVLHNILPDGMGFGWFRLDPGVFACEPARTFEGGPGLWGFLRSAKSYVIDDPAFGRVGVGCRVEIDGDETRAYPKDGLRKRILLVADRLNVVASSGEIAACVFNRITGTLRLMMEDSTGLVRMARVEIGGLAAGAYTLRAGTVSRALDVSGTLRVDIPVADAAFIVIERQSLP